MGVITTGRKNCGSKVISPSVAIVWGKNDGQEVEAGGLLKSKVLHMLCSEVCCMV